MLLEDQTIFTNIMFWGSNVTSQARGSLNYEMQALETLICTYSDCGFMCTPSIRQYWTKTSSYTHTTNATAQLLCGLERNRTVAVGCFLPNERELRNEQHTHRHRHSARPRRSERLASCFFSFCSGGPPPAMCSLFQCQSRRKATGVCVFLPVLLET